MKNCFIIVNYNDYDSTKHLVDNIVSYSIIDDILIVDNNSNIDEKNLLKNIQNKKVNIIYNDTNGGYSQAINIGCRYFIDKYEKCNFIISNSDIVILSEEDLKKCIDTLNSNENIGLVGPQILELGNIYRGCRIPRFRYEVMNNLPILRSLINTSKNLYPEEHYQTDISEVDVINSCFFLISSDVMQKINYMDENIVLYYEDFILAKKVKRLGYRSIICNKVKVKHLYSVSMDKVTKEYEKFKTLKRSQYYFHTTYNGINRIQRYVLKMSIYIAVILKKKNK